jgi:DNA-binding transcriptional ArsR family regulator
MRRKSVLNALFPRTRQAVLAATLMDPAREWYLSDLARHIGVSPSSLQRELASLVDAEILRRRVDGNRVYYRAEADNPIFGDLRGLLLRTAGLKDVLAERLAELRSRIDVAFVYGSVAREDERASSDVDLMVIGGVGLSELAPALKDAEARLLRPVNPSVYRAEEVVEKLRAGHHFLGTVMRGAKLFIVGGEDDLAAALERAPRPAARHEQARAR